MPKAASIDRRVRKETTILVKQAKALLAATPRHEGSAKLVAAMERAQQALAANDVGQMRSSLPALDALVDQVSPVSGKSAGLEYFESIAVAIVIALLLRAFVVEAFKIPSSSMYPTLEIGDHIFVNKLVYGMRMPFTGKKLLQPRFVQRFAGEQGRMQKERIAVAVCQPLTRFRQRLLQYRVDQHQIVSAGNQRVPLHHVECKHRGAALPRCQFDRSNSAPGALPSQQRRAGAAERFEHQVADVGVSLH